MKKHNKKKNSFIIPVFLSEWMIRQQLPGGEIYIP